MGLPSLEIFFSPLIFITYNVSKVLDVMDKLFVSIFDGLNEKCKKKLDAISQQYPFKPLKVYI